MVRWHGAEAVRAFLKELVALVEGSTPARWSATPTFPSTEYLTIDFTDFLCFNVYLHDETAFRRYIARLHNLAVDKPLVLTEFGVDSMRNGEEEQAHILSWQVRTAFAAGVAGTFVFAWTDEWFTGGHLIEDWAFGLVDRERQPKPAFYEVARPLQGRAAAAAAALSARLGRRLRLQRRAHDGGRASPRSRRSTTRITRSSSSMTARRTARSKSPSGFPYCRIISQPNKGLSVARNVGAEAATGEIVAYTDSDCVADPDWLTYLVAKMEASNLAACGGPEFSAARGQSGAGRGRGVAGRPDACADQRRGRRAHRRLQHGVPPRRAAGARRLRPGLPRRRRRCRHLLALPGCRLHDRLQPGRRRLAFPPQHGDGLYRPAEAATARPRRSSMPSTRSASTCSARRNGSAGSMAICRPRCCCRAGR